VDGKWPLVWEGKSDRIKSGKFSMRLPVKCQAPKMKEIYIIYEAEQQKK